VRALLAASANRRRKQSASRFVRSLRGRSERSLVVMSSEVETSREVTLGSATGFLDSVKFTLSERSKSNGLRSE